MQTPVTVTCTSNTPYFITPHFTMDSTSKVIFMAFDAEGNLCGDFQFNNGTWHLWSGMINSWMKDNQPQEFSEVLAACRQWLTEYYNRNNNQ